MVRCCHMKKPVLIELLKNDGNTSDDWGNVIPDIKRWHVFAEKRSVRQSEFYQAASQGLKPNVVFEIYADEFKNADSIISDNNEFSIIRTYQNTLDRLELVCERKIADGH